MDLDEIALLAGILFILIPVVGGGFSLKEVTIPKVPGWARIASLLLGLVFAAPWISTHPPLPGWWKAEDRVFGDQAESGDRVQVILYVDDDPDITRHGLKLTSLAARSRRDPPRVGDLVAVAFTLENVGEAPIILASAFVAARDPGGANRDFGYALEGVTLAPGEPVMVKAIMTVEAPGVWYFWPCYILVDGEADESAYCPTRWRAFSVPVAG